MENYELTLERAEWVKRDNLHETARLMSLMKNVAKDILNEEYDEKNGLSVGRALAHMTRFAKQLESLAGSASMNLDRYATYDHITREIEERDYKRRLKASNFIDDEEKMADFKVMSREEFLHSYSYLTEEEYENTMKLFLESIDG